MFKIILSPITSDKDSKPPLVSGNTITYNGVDYDFTDLPEGSQVEADSPFVGVIKNNAGVYEVTLQYFYCTDTAEPIQSTDLTDWGDYTFMINEGECPCPIKRKPAEVKE